MILSNIGLGIDALGVILIYCFALRDVERHVVTHGAKKPKIPQHVSRWIGHLGLVLVVVGFGLQIAGNLTRLD